MELAPLATTIELCATLKKAVPLHTSCRLDAWITGTASGGLRVHTAATLKHGATLLASCTATLVDVGRLRRVSQPSPAGGGGGAGGGGR